MADTSTHTFTELGRITGKYKHSRLAKVSMRRFKSHFGVTPDVVNDSWELVLEGDVIRYTNLLGTTRPDPTHLLWALMLLKVHSTWDILADFLKVDKNAVKKWSLLYLEAVAELDKEVVSFVWLF